MRNHPDDEAGCDRRAAASRDRLGDGARRSRCSTRAADTASTSRSSARVRRGSRARIGSRCAGHGVTIFDARAKPGGLNEYGIAAYKTVDDFAQREVEWLLVDRRHRDEDGVIARARHHARRAAQATTMPCFSASASAACSALALDGEALAGVLNAVDFIEQVRQAEDLATVPVGRRVVVIGGGNTAVDAAVQSRKLGAESVTMVYRRGVEKMSATWAEQEFAQTNGVTLVTHARPVRLASARGGQRARASSSSVGSGERFMIEADMVLKAIGQTLVPIGLDRRAADARRQPHRHRREPPDDARESLGGRRLRDARRTRPHRAGRAGRQARGGIDRCVVRS